MSPLQLNQQTSKTGTTQDLSFLKGASPIYVTSLSGNNVTPTATTVTTTTKSSEANNNIAASVKSASSTPAKSFENTKSNQPNNKVIFGKTTDTIVDQKSAVFNGNIPNSGSNIHTSISAEKGVSFFVVANI